MTTMTGLETQPETRSGARSRGGWVAVALVALTAALLASTALLVGGAASRQEAVDAASATFPGGTLHLDGVTAQHQMTAKDMGGMPMPKSPAVHAVPRGYRQFTISITVSARAPEGVRVTPDSFRLVVPGKPPATPIDDDTDVIFVPAGAAFPRDLTF